MEAARPVRGLDQAVAGKTVVRFGVYSAAAQTGLTDGSKVGVREEPGPIPRGLDHFLVVVPQL